MDDAILIRIAQLIVERQADETVGDVLSHGTLAGSPAKALPHVGQVQRLIVENGQHQPRSQMLDERRACLQRPSNQTQRLAAHRPAAGQPNVAPAF